VKKIKDFLYSLRFTPFHPQWLIYISKGEIDKRIREEANGIVLDIGCADQSLKKKISCKCTYIGLDYPGTVDTMYKTRPTVFGDAHQPPFERNSIDTIALLEVLEHVTDPETALRESCKLLRANGVLLMSMPFLYPIHDAPADYQRFTKFKLESFLSANKMTVETLITNSQPIVTAAALVNIALTKSVINSVKKMHLFILFAVFLPVIIPLVNLFGWLIGKLSPVDDFMPHNIFIVARKQR